MNRDNFCKFVEEEFGSEERFSTSDVKEALEKHKENEDYFPTDEEFEKISRNVNNNLTWMVSNGLIKSFGRRQGYVLANEEEIVAEVLDGPEEVNNEQLADNSRIEASETGGNTKWEFFMHFPATLALAERYSGKVRSLSSRTNEGWANPDMLMVRRNPLMQKIEDAELNVDAFRDVSNLTELVLTSIELKFNVTKRRDVMESIAECKANSGWANESLLVICEAGNTVELTSDMLDFAKICGVGVLVIRFSEVGLESSLIFPPVMRSNLELADHHLKTAVKILEETQELLQDKRKFPGEEDNDYETLAYRILRAGENLKGMGGFDSDDSFREQVERLKNDARHEGLFKGISQAIQFSWFESEEDSGSQREQLGKLEENLGRQMPVVEVNRFKDIVSLFS